MYLNFSANADTPNRKESGLTRLMAKPLRRYLKPAVCTFVEMSCVLVMNGSFNPPTAGHVHMLAMARNKAEELGYKIVKGIMVPTHGAYGKPGLADPDQRMEMCRLAVNGIDWIEVEPHDTEQEAWTCVVDTLAFVQAKYPDTRLMFVCGSDLILRWNDPVWPPEQVTEILTKYGVMGASRLETVESIVARVPVLEGKEEHIYMIGENPLSGLSSTQVRNLRSEGKCISGMVMPSVEAYILEKKLYS